MEKKTQKRQRAKSSPTNKSSMIKCKKQCTLEGYITKESTNENSPLPDRDHKHEDEAEKTLVDEDEDEAVVELQHQNSPTIPPSQPQSPPIVLVHESHPISPSSPHQMSSQQPSQDLSPVLAKQSELLQQILESQKQMQMNMAKFETYFSNINSRFKEQSSMIDQLSLRVNHLELNAPVEQLSKMEKLEKLEEKVNYMERKQRERNLRLVGITEDTDDSCMTIVWNIVNEELNVPAKIEDAYRAGRQGNQPRHIIVHCSNSDEKIAIFRAQRHALKNKSYFFVDDLSKKDYETKLAFKPQIDAARQQGKKWRFKNGALFVGGERFMKPEMSQSGHPQIPQPGQPQMSHIGQPPIPQIPQSGQPHMSQSQPGHHQALQPGQAGQPQGQSPQSGQTHMSQSQAGHPQAFQPGQAGQLQGLTPGQAHGQPRGQSHGQPNGQSHGQSHSQSQGQPHAQPPGYPLGQQHGHHPGYTQGHQPGQPQGQQNWQHDQQLRQPYGQQSVHPQGQQGLSQGQQLGQQNRSYSAVIQNNDFQAAPIKHQRQSYHNNIPSMTPCTQR
jgi:hypothetical protein